MIGVSDYFVNDDVVKGKKDGGEIDKERDEMLVCRENLELRN